MSEKGTIYTYSVIYIAAEAFKDKTPYVVAIVERPDQQKVMSLIENYKEGREIKIGMQVALSRYDEAGNPIYKFM